ncbi:pollen-specific leucine-rich repeat extensin-like protein 1 [Neltuma alba]|uniref:pollen-specific leucine-rich repeat extensin-like protein 1 n=1 Tax=Neltuma alba TaxID=207710 RepID=UPI0010A59355|nr:pollen-specific leucine-rich repeat extensin-like protein 1 [Prosopis alba]
MEDEEDMLPPFWLPSEGGRRRRLRRSSSLLFSSGALLTFIIVTACVIVFIVLPTLRSFTSHIFRPQLVKKSWDSLNLVLVLFAIVCGFLSRNSNETPRSYEDRSFSQAASARDYVKSIPETPPRRWYEYSESDRTVFNRMRSFNSYPDLRQESLWVAGDERWRFYDDTSVGGYRGSDLDDHRQLRHRHVRPEVVNEEQDAIKNIAVDTFVVRAEEVPSAPPIPETRQPPPFPHPSPPSPPPVQRTEGVRRQAKRSYHAAGRSEIIDKEEKDEFEVRMYQPPHSTVATPPPPPAPPVKVVRKNSRRTYRSSRPAPMTEKEEISELEVRNFPPPPRRSIPPPPPPPPLPLFYMSSEKKTGQGKKKRGSATKEFLTSLRGKKKKQRQRSVENFESILNSQAPQLPPSTPPPPPPLPPPPSVFHNLFSPRKSRHQKVHSVSPPQRAPSPPPVLSTRVSKTQKPPISNERQIFNSMEGNVLTGNESPFNPIPPPPPPPPFKIPAWKFRVHGDFVRIDSVRSSRSNSPDIDEGVDSPASQEQPTTPPLFCPSPDVDTKADTFIARFKAGLKLEKMNSIKGKSNLGPS